MTIYEHTTSVNINAGSLSSLTLSTPGGLIQQFMITTTGANTTFKANLVDQRNVTRRSYDLHKQELNDAGMFLPMVGKWTINITNVTIADKFNILLALQE